jgi:ribosomal-protein-alanine N-acetyltransferase
MLKGTHLETERLLLRPFDLRDTESLHGILRQEEVTRYLPEDVMSLEEVKRIVAWLTECYQKNTPEHIVKLTLAVVWKEDQRIIGWCGLGPLEFNPREIEIYYGLSKEYWGKGIATEAAQAMLRYAFDTIKLDKIVAVTHPENIASVKIIEKMGMISGKRIESLPAEHSYYEGCLYYSLYREEYLSRSESRTF